MTVLNWAQKHSDAVALYEEKLKLRRKDLPNFVKMAVADSYYQKGDFATSASLYHDVAISGDKKAQIGEAQALMRQGDPASAQKIYEALLRAKPGDQDVYLSRGNTRMLAGDYAKAIDDFEAAIKFVPTGDAGKAARRELSATLARAYIRAHDPGQAIAILKPFIESGDSDLYMQSDYVYAYRLNSSYEQAIAVAKKIWPDFSKVNTYGLQAVGDSYLRSNKPELAIPIYTVILQREPENQNVRIAMAFAKTLSNQVAEGIQLYDQAISADARLAEFAMDDCIYFVTLGRTWTAQKIFALLSTKVPNQSAFYKQYADKLAMSEFPRDAAKYYSVLRGLPGGATAGTSGVSSAATATGDYQQARKLLDSLSTDQLRTAAAAQASREYEERARGNVSASAVSVDDVKKQKQTFSAQLNAEQNVGGNLSVLGHVGHYFLKDDGEGTSTSMQTTGGGLRYRTSQFDFKAWMYAYGLSGMNGPSVSLDYYQSDRTIWGAKFQKTPLLTDVLAMNSGIMTSNYDFSFTRQIGLKDRVTATYGRGSIDDGNMTNTYGVNYDKTLDNNRKTRTIWSTYYDRKTWNFTSPLYESPASRDSIGTGIARRLYIPKGYWEFKFFPLAWSKDAGEPADYSPWARLEYGHHWTKDQYMVLGCEVGMTTQNALGDNNIGLGYRQCDINYYWGW